MKMTKAAFYIDGFNLYHALDDLRLPYLKWLDLWALGRRLADNRGGEREIARVVYCTAVSPDQDKAARHHQYIRALTHTGVDVLKGHFSSEPQTCRAACRQVFQRRTEKRSDVHLALSIFQDAYDAPEIDEFWLITSDGDQAATAEFLRHRFPAKTLVTVAPPGRDFNHAIRHYANGKAKITIEMVESCLFPITVLDPAKGVVARAPAEYHPPPGWIRPQDRPRRSNAQSATSN